MSIPIGPTLDVTVRRLDCGCCVDDAGGIWSPCRDIADIHAEAMAAVRAGVTDADMRATPRRPMWGSAYRRWNFERGCFELGEPSPPTLRDRLNDMARHVGRMG